MNRRSLGFSAVALLAVIVLVAGAGFSGWYVWHKHSANSHKTTTVTQSTHQSTEKADPSEGGKYLVIKEWGVRILLPQSLQGDVIYGIRKTVDLSLPSDASPAYGQVAYFASKKLAAINVPTNNCGLKSGAQDDSTHHSDPNSYEGGPGIALNRLTASSGSSQAGTTVIGQYTYTAVKGSAATCYTGSDGSQESQFIQSMLPALRTVEAIPQQ